MGCARKSHNGEIFSIQFLWRRCARVDSNAIISRLFLFSCTNPCTAGPVAPPRCAEKRSRRSGQRLLLNRIALSPAQQGFAASVDNGVGVEIKPRTPAARGIGQFDSTG